MPTHRLHPDDPRHGTASGYQHWGCRCDPCREAKRIAEFDTGEGRFTVVKFSGVPIFPAGTREREGNATDYHVVDERGRTQAVYPARDDTGARRRACSHARRLNRIERMAT